MKRLLYDVPLWHLMLHREHRGMPRAKAGDSHLLKLEDELFEVLYTGEGTPLASDEVNAALRPWADRVHASCRSLPQFERLAADCRGDAAAAAVAVETLMDELDDVPYSDGAQGPQPAPGSRNDPLRRPLQAACQAAQQQIAKLREAVEGLRNLSLGPRAGTSTDTAGHPTDLGRARSLLQTLRENSKLARIAQLAGRFKRMAAEKRRQRVRHGCDELTNIEQGADLARLLPSELGRLKHRLLRMDLYRRIHERQALQYQLVGNDTLTQGPIVVLLDKSTSMLSNDRDTWAAAVALAILEHASAQRRGFALLTFSGRIIREDVIAPGGSLPWDALTVRPEGSTSISTAVAAGLELIAHSPAPWKLRRSDIILITDGESDTAEAPRLRELAHTLNVNVLGVAIGMPADQLAPWCDDHRGATTLSTLESDLAESLFAA